MRILIVDDHRIVASGCRALFADDAEITRSILSAGSEWAAHKALLRSAVSGPPIDPAAPARVTSVPNASRV